MSRPSSRSLASRSPIKKQKSRAKKQKSFLLFSGVGAPLSRAPRYRVYSKGKQEHSLWRSPASPLNTHG